MVAGRAIDGVGSLHGGGYRGGGAGLEQQAKLIKQYGQVNEFLINYPNIEYIVRDKLSTGQSVDSSELPVQSKYALEYLKMYATAHQGAVVLDTKSGILKSANGNGSSQDKSSP